MNSEKKKILGDSQHTLYLIDISSFIFRAYYAINRALKNRSGEPTNATYGVASMLNRLTEEAAPHYLAVAYDSKEPSTRKALYAEYKANRSAPPEDLVPQFARIEELVKVLGMHSYRQSGVEADDLIATLTYKWCKKSRENHVVIVSGDKDLMQLVSDRVCIWDTMNDKIYDASGVIEKFGVSPNQIRDYLSLVGDSSDNIPGVPSIGPKTASELLKEFKTLEEVLNAAERGAIKGKKGETIKAHREDALLSARLVSLIGDLDLDINLKDLSYQFELSKECVDLLTHLDFKSMLAQWTKRAGGEIHSLGQSSKGPSTTSELAGPRAEQLDLFGGSITAEAPASMDSSAGSTAPVGRFKTISTQNEFLELLQKIEKKTEFGFDIETTSLNPREAQIVGISICVDATEAFYIPLGHQDTSIPQLQREVVLTALKPYLENPRYKKIGQNLKYDWSVLFQHEIYADGIGADTMVASYVLEPEGRHNLKTIAGKYLNYDVLSYEEVCGKGKTAITFDQVAIATATRYSAEDAWISLRLWEKTRPLLDQEGLMEIFSSVDLPLVPILAKMECTGVCIDEAWLAKLSREFGDELATLENKIHVFTKTPINLNSPKQLAIFLFDELKLPTHGKTKTGYSTDASVLEALAPLHEVPRLLLEYREISKLKGTYVDPLPLLKDKKTGRIHASFHQTVTATGRLSSSDPNLQNIPIRSERGNKIRRAFIPSSGNLLLSADYSQIELRLLAAMSEDPELMRSFLADEDVHQRTASEIFNVKPENVTEQERSIAKAINFGLMYGKTAFGLSQELHIPRREAQGIIERYFVKYAGVKRFLDRQVLEAKERGWTATLLGRKRHLPDIKSQNGMLRANAERMAMNAPIQGTAADMIKLAMIQLHEALKERGLQSKLIIQVHDELVLDCPRKEIEEVRALVTQVMEGAMKLAVPLRVNSAVGENWMEL